MTTKPSERWWALATAALLLGSVTHARATETCPSASANFLTKVVNAAKVCVIKRVPAGRSCSNLNRVLDRRASTVNSLCLAGDVDRLSCSARLAIIAAGLPYANLTGSGFNYICNTASCGNGIVEAGEQCDDANTINGDGCSAACQLESNQCTDVCAGVTSVSGTTVKAELVAGGFSNPLYVTAPPRDVTRIFVVEQTGAIRIVKFGSVLPTPFLDISAKVSNGSEQGLLGLAFHPDYANNGQFFVDYTDTSGNTVVSRYQVSANPDVASTTETMLLGITQPFANHNGGQLLFGPDGYLYIFSGDGGSGGDPMGNGQNLNTRLGKILRIDVDSGSPFGIPLTNPFVGFPGLDEIWAYGMRNPWRNSFDRATGDLYIGDVGQNLYEEVDFQPAASPGGQNYGWNIMEGLHCFNPPSGCDMTGLTLPIHEHPHGSGPVCGGSITGGYVYRGCKMPDLQGTYFYGDYCLQFVHTFKVVGGVAMGDQDVTPQLESGGVDITGITSFGEDARGELYICNQSGEVFKIVPGP
jgi:cysteine-rich repeat protein